MAKLKQSRQAEIELLRMARQGDQEALRTLLTARPGSLYAVAFRVLGNAADAEDAVQRGLSLAYFHLHQFQGRSAFSTWLTRIVMSAALMQRRSRNTRPEINLLETSETLEPSVSRMFTDPRPDPEALCRKRELRDQLIRHCLRLPPGLRTTFLLRAVKQLTTRETARILAISETAVKGRLGRARRQLACWVKEDAGIPDTGAKYARAVTREQNAQIGCAVDSVLSRQKTVGMAQMVSQ